MVLLEFLNICDRPTASNSIQQPWWNLKFYLEYRFWCPHDPRNGQNHPMTLAMGMMSPLVPPVSSWLEHPPWIVQWLIHPLKWWFSRVMLVYQRVEISMFVVDFQTSHVWFSKGNRRQSFRTRFVGHDFAAPYTGWCIAISISIFPSVCLSVRECILPIYLYSIGIYTVYTYKHKYIYIYTYGLVPCSYTPPMVPLPSYLLGRCSISDYQPRIY